jgi:hypothetical protein
MPTRGKINKNSGNFVMSIGHEVGVIKLPDMAAGHGNPSVLTNQIQRYITELSAAGSMYDQFSSAITLDGDFDISIDVYITSLATQTLLGRETGEDYFLLRSDGAIRVRIDSTDYQTAAGIVIVNQFAQVRARRVGTTLDILYAGVNVGSFTGAAGTMTLDRVGQFADTFYLSGMWANLLVEANGTLIVDAKKDGDGTSNIIVNAVGTPYLTRVNQTTDEVTLYTVEEGNYIGPELWELPAYMFAGTEVSGDIIQSENILQVGATYRVTFSGSGANVGVATGSGGSTRALIGNSSIYADANPFDVTEDVTALTVTAEWQVIGTPPFAGSCSIDSVRRLIEVA